MKYLLDTNVCIRFLTGRSNSIRQKIENNDLMSMLICSIVRGELEYGARKSVNPDKALNNLSGFLSCFPEINYDSASAQEYGRIRAQLELKGTPIGPYDMQIAAIAIAHHLTLVTHNTNEFKRIPDLLLTDWE